MKRKKWTPNRGFAYSTYTLSSKLFPKYIGDQSSFPSWPCHELSYHFLNATLTKICCVVADNLNELHNIHFQDLGILCQLTVKNIWSVYQKVYKIRSFEILRKSFCVPSHKHFWITWNIVITDVLLRAGSYSLEQDHLARAELSLRFQIVCVFQIALSYLVDHQ